MRAYNGFDPIQDHWNYVNDLGLKEQIRNEVAAKMYDMKHDALERIDAVIHPEQAANFIKILQYAVNENLPEAESLARDLGLNQEHFLALDNDERGMREFLDKDFFSRTPDLDVYDYDYDRYI